MAQRSKQYKKALEQLTPGHFYSPNHAVAVVKKTGSEKFDSTVRKESVQLRKMEIREQSNCSKLILGVDRLDYSKGILERLSAF